MTAVRISADPVAEILALDGEPPGEKLDLPAMERALSVVLDRYGLTDAAPEMLQGLAERDPHLFFTAGIARLALEGGPPGHRRRSLRLFDAPAFLLELVRSHYFSDGELKEFCAKYVREDTLLDVKLARLMPGRRSDFYHLETGLILRILDVLDEISPGTRLLMIIGHLTGYAEQRVASKAALLVGRRLQNHEWVERHLSSPDPRIRANVVEALWRVNSALAARTLRKCLQDENNRVQGNAIIGLHMLGDQNVNWRIRQLTKDLRSAYRQTAAWVIGRVKDPELTPLLEGLLVDPDARVRQSAENALERLCETKPAAAAPESSANAQIAVAPECAEGEAAPPQPPVENDPAATQPDGIAPPPDSSGSDGPGQGTLPTATSESNAAAVHLRLDGRYVTGD
jgi:hypothetical protein